MQHHITRNGEWRSRIVARMFAALATVAIVVGVVGFGAPAAAGGWALGSLDAVPDAREGATEQVGFTVLQHGVTPAAIDGDVGVELVGPNGEVTFFEAVADGPIGHYVATVTFPPAGDYSWNIRMGWFPPQDLGSLNVQPADSSSGGVAPWSAVRWGILGVAVTLAAVAVISQVSGRRRAALSS